MAKDFLRGTTRLPLVFLQVRYRGNGFGAFGTAHKQTYKGRLAFPLGGVPLLEVAVLIYILVPYFPRHPPLLVSILLRLIVVIGFTERSEVLAAGARAER